MYFLLADTNPREVGNSLFPTYQLVKEKGGLPKDIPTTGRGIPLAFRDEQSAISILNRLNNAAQRNRTNSQL